MVGQVKGGFEVRDPIMLKYHTKVKSLLAKIQKSEIINLPHSDTAEADLIAKAASEGHEVYQVPLYHQHRPCFEEETVLMTNSQVSWMTPIIKYLKDGILPEDKVQASKIARMAHQFTLDNDVLYKMTFLQP